MDDLKERLIRSFSVVFPELDQEAIARATTSSVATWDSVATVTLVNVVEEEFGAQIAMDDVEGLGSFEEFSEYLRAREDIAK